MRFWNPYAGSLKGKIIGALRIARPEARKDTIAKAGTACNNAGSENEARLRQARYNAEAAAAIAAMRLIR